MNLQLGNIGNIANLGNLTAKKVKLADIQISVYVDVRNSCIEIYTAKTDDTVDIQKSVKEYDCEPFTEKFYEKMEEVATDLASTVSNESVPDVNVVLPDYIVFTGIFAIPQLSSNAMKTTSINTTINGMYKNRSELTITNERIAQSKQTITVAYAGVKSEIVESIKSAFSLAKLPVSSVTFESEAVADGLSAVLSSKRNETYLFMDIKEYYTQVAYVFKGRAIGFSSLPFGYDILSGTELSAEDMLFDHQMAELAVLNAREKAKSKKLTIAADAGDLDNIDDIEINSGSMQQTEQKVAQIKVLPKKQPRKLPKFMQRPEPETEEGYISENFRIFVKRALLFIECNEKFKNLGDCSCVLCNLPLEYNFVFDVINEEEQENKIKFLPASLEKENPIANESLPGFGGLFARKYNVTNNFC